MYRRNVFIDDAAGDSEGDVPYDVDEDADEAGLSSADDIIDDGEEEEL